jgi:hypothetical protein
MDASGALAASHAAPARGARGRATPRRGQTAPGWGRAAHSTLGRARQQWPRAHHARAVPRSRCHGSATPWAAPCQGGGCRARMGRTRQAAGTPSRAIRVGLHRAADAKKPRAQEPCAAQQGMPGGRSLKTPRKGGERRTVGGWVYLDRRR